jgi:hypothetical protein
MPVAFSSSIQLCGSLAGNFLFGEIIMPFDIISQATAMYQK